MSVNKNFVVKNGLEVSTDLILADAARNKVGIGSTTPRTELDVRGGIAATDINISGVGTIVTLQSITGAITNLTTTNLSAGVGTVGVVQATHIRASGVTTAATLNVTGTGTIAVGVVTNLSGTNLNYSGISTFGVTTTTDLTSQQLNVSGVSTLGITSVSQLNVSGVSTHTGNLNVNGSVTELSNIVNIRTAPSGNLTASFDSGGQSTLYYNGTQRFQTSPVGAVVNGNFTVQSNGNISAGSLTLGGVSGATGGLNVTSGITTLGVTTVTDLTSQQFNVSGISTFTSLRSTNINVSGITTLNVTTVTDLTAQQLNVSGISTLGNIKIVSGIVTAISGVVTYYGDGSYLTGLSGNPPLQTVLNVGNTSTLGIDVGISTFNNKVIVGGGTTALVVSGDVRISGVVTAIDFDALSDINYKENISTVNNALLKIEQLRGVSFDWKESGLSSYGVIAQELQEVLPELVHGNNPKTVNYNGIIGVLIEAIKELKEEMKELKEKLL